MSFLVTRGLGKDYGKTTAVHALDLVVEPGEIFGFLGPNGAGKSTAIHMIAGVVTPSRGSASLGGRDLLTEGLLVRRQLGLVPQELALYEDLTALHNLEYFGALQGLKGDALKRGIDFGLAVAGLADRAQDRVSTFSGGMKRRLNLAASILHRPKLLICDEPTVGVDPQSRAHLFEALRRLNREENTTIIYTSHYMEEVQALCRRIGIMDRGRLVAMDSIQGLLAAHAQGGIELQVEGEIAAAASALGSDMPHHIDGRKLVFGDGIALSRLAARLENAGVTVSSIERRGNDLESVFLKLTGRALRDES